MGVVFIERDEIDEVFKKLIDVWISVLDEAEKRLNVEILDSELDEVEVFSTPGYRVKEVVVKAFTDSRTLRIPIAKLKYYDDAVEAEIYSVEKALSEIY